MAQREELKRLCKMRIGIEKGLNKLKGLKEAVEILKKAIEKQRLLTNARKADLRIARKQKNK